VLEAPLRTLTVGRGPRSGPLVLSKRGWGKEA